jgi:hypothetical protein
MWFKNLLGLMFIGMVLWCGLVVLAMWWRVPCIWSCHILDAGTEIQTGQRP